MNTNQKGVKGLIKVIDNLQENGYYSFPAFDDHSPVDLIAVDRFGTTYKLQIKYRSKGKPGKYLLSCMSVVNGKKVPIDRNLIDGWAVYLEEDKKVIYIQKNVLDNKTYLTIEPSLYKGLETWQNGNAASC